jgi:hypothetical protein
VPSKVEKGTQGVDGRVAAPGRAGKEYRAFVITLGRAGEDNKSFRLTDDRESAFASFAGADYDLQVRPGQRRSGGEGRGGGGEGSAKTRSAPGKKTNAENPLPPKKTQPKPHPTSTTKQKQDSLSNATNVKVTERTDEATGVSFYDYDIDSPDYRYLSSIAVKGGKVFALFVRSPARGFEAQEKDLRHIQETFKLL